MKPDHQSTQLSVPHDEPIRTCLGCRTKGSKSEMLRLVARTGGIVICDPQGSQPGRGAYVHPRRDCWIIGQRRVRSSLRLSDPVDLAIVDEFLNHLLADEKFTNSPASPDVHQKDYREHANERLLMRPLT